MSADKMADSTQNFVDQGLDVYYVTAGFGAGETAVADNAVAKRELYVDIDCGPGKPYADKNEGAVALRTFCKETNLPRPTIVDSGNGLHAHWIFTQSVAVHEWSEVATSLKALCKDKGFNVDSACTADTVRVLRVPETINSKNGQVVTLLTPIVHYEFAALRAVIGQIMIPSKDIFAKARALSKSGSGTTQSLAQGDPNRISKFQTIWVKSVGGTGCAQIQNAIANSDTLPEPVWRGVLSIAQQCEDRDWGVHEISKNHPNYSPDETETKAIYTRGPYTCETFNGLDTGHLCAGCQHAGKITSPIQLGSTIKEAPREPSKVEVDGKAIVIPVLPFPYTRGASGGVYMHKKAVEDGEPEVEIIYPYDLYVYRRMRESDLGDVVWMRHHLPNDAIRDFMIAQKEVGAIDKFREKLNEQGVAVFTPAQLTKLQAYVAKSIQDLQMRDRAEEMYTRFGWTRENTFIIGNREYTPRGVMHAPVARHLEKYVPWFTPKGSLETWKTIIDAYNAPEFDLHAFGVLSGFGSVLMSMSPENGAVINYFSKKSGTGKTTILRCINSIFGDSRALMKDAQDTHLTKVHRMGTLNGIPMCLDEMTNATPQELSGLLYGSTQGRARDRMESGRNMERSNDLVWKMITVWSSNTSVEDRLGMIKVDPQGELARVIEINLQTPVPSDVLESQKLFNELNENYGHAGDIFVNYVVSNLDLVKKMWNETRDLIYSKGKWTQTERYRLNAVICAITAGVITNNLGLTNFNLSRIARRMINVIRVGVVEQALRSVQASETVAAFVNHNVNSMLSIDSKQRANGLQNEPYIKPKHNLIIRYEPDTKNLFIVQKDFNRWCSENYINTRELPNMFEAETGSKLLVVKKRMGAGWDADFGAVNAYCIINAAQVLGFEDSELVTDKPE